MGMKEDIQAKIAEHTAQVLCVTCFAVCVIVTVP